MKEKEQCNADCPEKLRSQDMLICFLTLHHKLKLVEPASTKTIDPQTVLLRIRIAWHHTYHFMLKYA